MRNYDVRVGGAITNTYRLGVRGLGFATGVENQWFFKLEICFFLFFLFFCFFMVFGF